MPRTLRYTLASLRELIVAGGPFILLTVGLLALAYWWLDPNPPRRVTLATGPAQSAYAEIGARYQKALARSGIEVVLLPTEGSSANLALVQQGQADIGFVQGGSRARAQQDDTAAPLALGDLFLEPVWLFYWEKSARQATGQPSLDNLRGLAGLRVNVGTAGSGVPRLMDSLFALNRLEPGDIRLTQLAETAGTVAFLDGQSDALVFASAPESLMVQMLLQTPGVRLMDFAQHEAYARRLPFLAPVTLPRGVVDLASDIPPADVRLVAPTTTLLARPGLHPALLQLFAQASLTLHGNAGWFHRAREYPQPTHAEFALSKEAERTIRNGVPLLQRYLPFHLANLLERMWLSLGIIVALLLPLSRVVPPLYEFRIRSRVFRWYAQLRDIEERIEEGADKRAGLLDELDALEQRVGKVVVPLSHTDELYSLRNHIQMVRNKVSR
jgi:NMT1-like family